jgi:ParB-like chromosome segregation protein Spo0J
MRCKTAFPATERLPAIVYHSTANQRLIEAGILNALLRTLLKVAAASLVAGAILSHFGITTDQLMQRFGLSQERVVELLQHGLTWALPKALLGSLVIVPVWFLIYLFRPPGARSD